MAPSFRHARIAEIRKALGLTQAEFARRVGVSRQLVSFWEQGKNVPGAEILMRIVRVTGAKIDSFFAESAHTQSVRRSG